MWPTMDVAEPKYLFSWQASIRLMADLALRKY
jgi:hypothetical protein